MIRPTQSDVIARTRLALPPNLLRLFFPNLPRSFAVVRRRSARSRRGEARAADGVELHLRARDDVAAVPRRGLVRTVDGKVAPAAQKRAVLVAHDVDGVRLREVLRRGEGGRRGQDA
jgi:hypothetical protein